MKKMIPVLFALTVAVLFSACGQKTADSEKTSLKGDAYGAGGALSLSEIDSMTDKEKDASVDCSPGTSAGADEAETATAVPVVCEGGPTTGVYLPEADVYVGRFEQDSLGARLSAADAEKVCGIIGKYKMDQFSWDNISDYTIVVNGVYYSYDSSGGIVTKDDTHADMLSEFDRKEFNRIIGVKAERCGNDETLASDADTVTDTFIVERAAGTHLELRKADGGDTALYSCDYGRLAGADEMKFSEGDQVVVRYDREVMETWPVQMTVREIYPAEWN
ncbi:MAG: hypothetical protein K6G90_08745 [Clostridia bacterium]|nr:hypothetical protein [Clostridia bacterium]